MSSFAACSAPCAGWAETSSQIQTLSVTRTPSRIMASLASWCWNLCCRMIRSGRSPSLALRTERACARRTYRGRCPLSYGRSQLLAGRRRRKELHKHRRRGSLVFRLQSFHQLFASARCLRKESHSINPSSLSALIKRAAVMGSD